MQKIINHTQILTENKVCVIIPSYNNAGTLSKVIKDVLKYSTDVLVVNDGSTDNTSEVLSKFKNIRIISYAKNRGKGYALRKGFKFAIDNMELIKWRLGDISSEEPPRIVLENMLVCGNCHSFSNNDPSKIATII